MIKPIYLQTLWPNLECKESEVKLPDESTANSCRMQPVPENLLKPEVAGRTELLRRGNYPCSRTCSTLRTCSLCRPLKTTFARLRRMTKASQVSKAVENQDAEKGLSKRDAKCLLTSRTAIPSASQSAFILEATC